MKRRVQEETPGLDAPPDQATYKLLVEEFESHGFEGDRPGWDKRFILDKKPRPPGAKGVVAFAISISFVTPTVPKDAAMAMIHFKAHTDSALRCISAAFQTGEVHYTAKLQKTPINTAIILSAFQLV